MRYAPHTMALALLFANMSAAHAERDRIRVDRLSDEQIAYIARGWSYVPQACAMEVINEIEDYGSGNYWFIILDDMKDEILFERPDTGHKEICNLDGRIEVDPSGKRNFLEIQ